MSTPARATRLPRLVSHLRRRGSEQSGAVLLIVTVLMTAILASAALAIDVGSFYHAQRQAQAAADAGALAAAQDMAGSASATATSDGTTIAQTNYPGATVTVSEPTTNEAKVIVNASTPSFLGRALGVTGAKVSATAVAGVTGGSTKCTSPGTGCYVIFAMDTNCSGNPVTITSSGTDVNGGIWSNGSIDVTSSGSHFGPTYYGNGNGCAVRGAMSGSSYTSGPTQEPPQTTWPIDYSTDFPACGGSGELACTGPCDVSASPCPVANRTPSFCTLATNARSETLMSPASGNIYCEVGSGTASDPSSWNGTISIVMSGGPTIESSFVAGRLSLTGSGVTFKACGYSTSGYQASACNTNVPSPSTSNYPFAYVVGTGSPFTDTASGTSLTGDVFAPNGKITNTASGTTYLGFLEAQDVTWTSSGMTGDGPSSGSTASTGGGTISLLQ